MSEPGAATGDDPWRPRDRSQPTSCDAAPDPGAVAAHRLNRVEYVNSVRDVFGATVDPSMLPADPRSSSFDNNAALLSMSELLTEGYLDVAELVADDVMTTRRAAIVTCDPAAIGGRACAAEVLAPLAERAFRRPLEPGELDRLVAFLDVAADEGDGFDIGLSLAIQAILVSPQFLFRIVGVDAAGPIHRLNDFEIASRMSYFLWSTTPDDALLAAARDGELTDSAGRRAQFDRMLADPRAAALVDRFAVQWLGLGKIDAAQPDPMLFPELDDALRDQMRAETLQLVRHVVDTDRSALDLLTADYSFVAEELAAVYGISGVTGPTPQRVSLAGAPRSGILTHPGILMMSSKADRSSPIRRGFWVLATLLCGEPPPPPDDVVTEIEPEAGTTLREQLEQHRADPSCAACHDMMDPIGFGLEGYDVLGRYRTTDDDGLAIDDEGTLPDGTTFRGARELADVLLTSGDFETCLTEKLMTYGLGREMDGADSCVVDRIATESIGPEEGMTALLWAVVDSEPFLQQVVE